ncbi:MAG TPA: glycosyltransferase family 4 protein [Pseudonocardiaceae bacterium]|nr:glycosyltransferase family 4 protein [Pseudonocardiaceae bacterium]
MRVLALLHLYAPHHCAGAEMAAHALLRALADRGHEVDVLLSRPHPEITQPYTWDGVRVHPRRDKADPVRWLADAGRAPHVMVAHLECTNRATILGGLYGVPVVHLLHNTHLPTKQALTRRPALAVANTRWMAEHLGAWWDAEQPGQLMPPTIVIHPPVDPAVYRTTPGTQVTLVNCTPVKGSDTFYALAERFPRTHFVAVEGAYGVQDRRQRPNVKWLAHVPGHKMRSVYRRTRVLLMPSEYESYGRVAIEAACSGIPTIAAPTPGLREALGDAASYADRDDVDAWSAHLRRLLTPAGWSAASARATARVNELHTDADLDRWVSALEGVSRWNHSPHSTTSPPATPAH